MSVAALAVVAVAGSPAVLLAGMAAVGLLAVVAQVLVAYAATLARPHERGRVVGAVTSGIVVGILLARTFAGLVTELASWRAVYLASAGLTLVLTAVCCVACRPTTAAASGSRTGRCSARRSRSLPARRRCASGGRSRC